MWTMAKSVNSECNDFIVGRCSNSTIFGSMTIPPDNITTDGARKGVCCFQWLWNLASKIGRIGFKIPPGWSWLASLDLSTDQ